MLNPEKPAAPLQNKHPQNSKKTYSEIPVQEPHPARGAVLIFHFLWFCRLVSEGRLRFLTAFLSRRSVCLEPESPLYLLLPTLPPRKNELLSDTNSFLLLPMRGVGVGKGRNELMSDTTPKRENAELWAWAGQGRSGVGGRVGSGKNESVSDHSQNGLGRAGAWVKATAETEVICSGGSIAQWYRAHWAKAKTN